MAQPRRRSSSSGELLKEMKESGQRDPGGRGAIESRATTQLSDLGITRDQSSKWQKLAALDEQVFETLLTAVQEEKELTTAAMLGAIKQGERAAREDESISRSKRTLRQALCVEFKIVRPVPEPYTAFALETQSCIVEGRQSDGWMPETR